MHNTTDLDSRMPMDYISDAQTPASIPPQPDTAFHANHRSGVGFYEAGGEEESARLELMATLANPISQRAIERLATALAYEQGATVVDLGCGASTVLGQSLERNGFRYTPVDDNREFVSNHLKAGFSAIKSPVTNTGIEAGTFDIAHARFVLSWLGKEEERALALAETLKIGREPMGLAVIDYDWSVVDGPEEFKEAVNYTLGIMKGFGFDPGYGSRLQTDIPAQLTKNFLLPEGAVRFHTERHSVLPTTMREAMPFVEATARAVLDKIDGLLELEAGTLRDHLVTVRQYAEANPDSEVVLPDIVTLQAVFQEKLAQKGERQEIISAYKNMGGFAVESSHFTEPTDYEVAVPGIDALNRIVIARSPELIELARKAQAFKYLMKSVVRPDAIELDPHSAAYGLLKSHIDPPEQVERSVYMVARHNGNRSGMRAIEPNEQGHLSIPTIQRMMDEAPEAYHELYRDYIAPTDRVVEFSGVYGDSIQDVMDCIIAHANFAYEQGYDKAVMGLVEDQVGLFEWLLGPEVLQKLKSSDARHHIELTGVNSEKSFVTFVVDIQSCMERAYQYTNNLRSKHSVFANTADTTLKIIERRRAQ